MNEPKKRGPKPWLPTPEKLERITELYSHGVSEKTIAGAVGLCPQTFSTKKNDFPEISEALNRGLEIKAERSLRAVELLWERIENGANGLLCFWLKTQEGWDENSSEERIQREIEQRTSQEIERIERDIGIKLLHDADVRYANQMQTLYAALKRELPPEIYDRIVEIYPRSTAFAEARSEIASQAGSEFTHPERS